MTDLSFLDTDTSKIDVPRELPKGEYLAQLKNYEREDRDDGKVNYTLEFKVLEALTPDVDLTNVNLNRSYFSKRIPVSEKNLGYVLRDMNKFGVDLNGVPFRDIFSKLVEAEPTVKVYVDLDEWLFKNRDIEKAVVQRWSPAA